MQKQLHTILARTGVDNLVTNAERICTYEQQRMELANEAVIHGLEVSSKLLLAEERRIEERLLLAPPHGDLRRLRRANLLLVAHIAAHRLPDSFSLSIPLRPFDWAG